MAEDAGGSKSRKGQLPDTAQQVLLHAIRQCRAMDTRQWERLERAAQAGAGTRVERAIVQLGTAMGDIIDELSDTLEFTWHDPLTEAASEGSAACDAAARR
jgi:hypothetical protein